MAAARSSALSRSVAWFREGNLDEVRIAFALVKEIVEARLTKSAQPGLFAPPKRARNRKPAVKPTAAPASSGVAASTVAGTAAMSASAGSGPAEQAQTLGDA